MMLDPITAVYALLAGIGLISADTYINSETVHVETKVAPAFVEEGYDPILVETLFLADLTNIINAKSMIASPRLVSSQNEPMSDAIAEAVGLSHALTAAKSTLGIDHPKLILSIMARKEENGNRIERIVVAGKGAHNRKIRIAIPLNDRSLDAAIKEAAFEVMKQIDPYVAALFAFDMAELDQRQPTEVLQLLTELLKDENMAPINSSRARLENLMGLTHLLLNNVEDARVWFKASVNSDPSFSYAVLNKAFVEAVIGHCDDAITLVEPLIEPSYWVFAQDKFLRYPAQNLLGLCSSRLGHYDVAEEYFAASARDIPDGTSVYFYWAQSLLVQGRKEEADATIRTGQRNISVTHLVSENAMLYYWINDNGTTKYQKRTHVLPPLITNPNTAQ